MSDTRFWNATEHAEQDFTGRADVAEFRRRMTRLGHETPIIRERVEAIHAHLLARFDGARDCLFCEGAPEIQRMLNHYKAPAAPGWNGAREMVRIVCGCGAIGKCRPSLEAAIETWNAPWQARIEQVLR